MSTCENAELLRDYAFGELPAANLPAFERHLAQCAECTGELDQLRLTTAALRALPDREPPQRIAFVSDKVFVPSRIWNFAPWLGFASAAVMAAALIVTVYHRPAGVKTVEVRTVMVPAAAGSAASAQPVDDVVRRAVAEAREEDAKIFRAEFQAAEAKHEREHLMLADFVKMMAQEKNTGVLLNNADFKETKQ